MKFAAVLTLFAIAFPAVLGEALPEDDHVNPVWAENHEILEGSIREFEREAGTDGGMVGQNGNTTQTLTAFTVGFVTRAFDIYPNWNWALASYGLVTYKFDDSKQVHVFQNVTFGRYDYVAYAFKAGWINNIGKGGNAEWAYIGNNLPEVGNNVTFETPLADL